MRIQVKAKKRARADGNEPLTNHSIEQKKLYLSVSFIKIKPEMSLLTVKIFVYSFFPLTIHTHKRIAKMDLDEFIRMKFFLIEFELNHMFGVGNFSRLVNF